MNCLTFLPVQARCTLSVVDEARVLATDGHAAWSESFNEMFAQVAGEFGNVLRPSWLTRSGSPPGYSNWLRQPSL